MPGWPWCGGDFPAGVSVKIAFMDPRCQVASDEDLWTLVLGYLPMSMLGKCASTCKAHVALATRVGESFSHLGLTLTHASKERTFASTLPDLVLQPAKGCEGFILNESSRAQGAEMSTVSLGDWPVLPSVTRLMPRLTHLIIDLSPEVGVSGHVLESVSDGMEDLCAVANRFAAKRPVSRWTLKTTHAGPEPWFMLGAKLNTLTLTCEEVDQQGREAWRENRSSPTVEALDSILLACAVASQESLESLDLTGIGALVLSSLLTLDLPNLVRLRIGEELPSTQVCAQFREYPSDLLSLLGAKFPTLTALDIGYAPVKDGVSFDEIAHLCTLCQNLQHLDLSMVMRFRNFGPALKILGQLAPNLRSLAIHGLALPGDALSQFAQGCLCLERVHFVECDADPYGFARFLSAATRLRDIHFSSQDFGGHDEIYYEIGLEDVIDKWVEERLNTRSSVRPRSIVLAGNPLADEMRFASYDPFIHGFVSVGEAQSGIEKLHVPLHLRTSKLKDIRANLQRQLALARQAWNPNGSNAPRAPDDYSLLTSALARWVDVFILVASGQLRLFHNVTENGTSAKPGKLHVSRSKKFDLMIDEVVEMINHLDCQESQLEMGGLAVEPLSVTGS